MIVDRRSDRCNRGRFKDARAGATPTFAVLLCLIGSLAGCTDAHSGGGAGQGQRMQLLGGGYAEFGRWGDDVFFLDHPDFA